MGSLGMGSQHSDIDGCIMAKQLTGNHGVDNRLITLPVEFTIMPSDKMSFLHVSIFQSYSPFCLSVTK